MTPQTFWTPTYFLGALFCMGFWDSKGGRGGLPRVLTNFLWPPSIGTLTQPREQPEHSPNTARTGGKLPEPQITVGILLVARV